jgi:hypothetical protein
MKHTSTSTTARARRGSLPLVLALLLPPALTGSAACSDDPDRDDDGGDDGSDDGDDGDGGDQPLYALMTQVYAVDDRTVYVTLSDTLDLSAISLDDARELNGVANLAAVGGALLISDGEQPVITRYDITDEDEWVERGAVSFADYPVVDNANFYYQFILDDHTAYLPFESTKRIVWDPTDMEIVTTREESSLELERDGLRLEAGGNRDGVRYDDAVLQALFYHDDDWFEFGTASHIAVYDPETHEEERVIEAPCAGLAIATRDEAGYIYFSTWDYMPTRALFGDGPAPCVVRVGPDLALDEAWTTDLTEWTDGRLAVNFRHVGDGKAIANVLHHEELDGDLEGEYDPAVEEQVWLPGPHWRLWLFDLEQGQGQPVDGIDVDIGSGAQVASLDGRVFVFLPYDSWARTAAYELAGDGTATKLFDTAGDVFKWIKVR